MADLSDLIKDKSIKFPTEQANATGRKRRAWLDLEDKTSTKPSTKTSKKLNSFTSKELVKEFKPSTKTSKDSSAKLVTNWEQTSKNLVRKLVKKNNEPVYTILAGIQRKIMEIIFSEACKNGLRRTTAISSAFIVQTCETSTNTARKSIQVLEKKGYLTRKEFKHGRGGWTKYEVNESVFNEMGQLKAEGKIWGLTSNKLVTNWEKHSTQTSTQTSNSGPSSSSYLNNINTTTTNEVTASKNHLPDAWLEIQTPAILKDLKFGINIVRQICEANLMSPENLQMSFDAFAFDIQENNILEKKKIGDPLRYFMGIMRKKNPYLPPSNYQSDEEKAIAEMLTREKEINKKRKKQEEELKQLKFESWTSSLSEQEKKELGSFDTSVMTYMGSIHMANLKGHFESQFWPSMWEKIQMETRKQ